MTVFYGPRGMTPEQVAAFWPTVSVAQARILAMELDNGLHAEELSMLLEGESDG